MASSLIDQIIPRVSLPLIQIAIGLLIAVVAGGDVEVTLDPELFLVMFIAPLLYDEAKHADKQALWRERKPVLSLAIGLVVATTLVIGFLLNAFVPSIPLAAAFALGAALGPTDAVAVSSLSKQVDIPKRQASMLKGELLLNDASGIVSFQFAIAAVVTGAFSLIDASVDFLVEFVGGLILGVLLGLLGNWVVKRARSIGVENTNFHVLFEVLIPFLIYLVANVCHVSGVIAVVVAGLINVTSPKGVIGPSVSRMNIVSGSVWHVLTYALNGIVFVLLGTQLPLAMQDTWENVRITNSTLILLVFGLTFVLLATRFLWVLAMDLYHVRRDEKRRFGKGDLRSALITTFCGAKGTITLSIMFSIPTYAVYGPPNVPFPQRELLIFLACGVIVCTLLLATFVVPLLAPARDKGEEELRRIDQDAATTMDIMREVIEMLDGPADAGEPRGDPGGHSLLQRPPRAHQGQQRHRERDERGAARSGPYVGVRARHGADGARRRLRRGGLPLHGASRAGHAASAARQGARHVEALERPLPGAVAPRRARGAARAAGQHGAG